MGEFMPPLRFARLVTVKDRVGRVRYVAFQLVEGAPLPRPALAGALPSYAKLTRFDGTYGIVRVGHRDRDAALAVLKGMARLGGREVRVETLTTSGTIRGAARALPAASEASRRTPPRRD
jgi:hypothetical protein